MMESFRYIDDDSTIYASNNDVKQHRQSVSSSTKSQKNGHDGVHKIKPKEDTKEEEDDPNLTSCGIGSWRPQWLQVLNNPVYFLINICIIGIVQSMTGSLMYMSMNMLERRYAFDSKVGIGY